jgi:hypothetical protein
MCGNPNPEGLEVCQHCGARLVPLDLSKGGSPEDESLDWLDQIRAEASAEDPDRDVGEAEPEPAPSETEPEFEDLESMLAGLEPEPSAEEPEPAEEEEQPESLGFDVAAAIGFEPGTGDLSEPEVPEWLRRIREKQAAEGQAEQGQAEEADDFDLRAAFAQQDEADVADDAGQIDDLSPGAEISELSAEPDLPEAAPEPEPVPVEPAEVEPAEPELAEPEPTELEPISSEQVEVESPSELPEFDPGPGFEPEQEQPADAEPAEAELPAWMQEVGAGEPEPEAEGPLPHVQALIGEEAEAVEADDLGIPDWLGEIEPLEQPSEPEPDTGPDLAPATLPNWLEAMRPVDTFRSVVQIDSEEDQSIESVGPLAGLRGVLNAEPVVAMPRTSTVGSMQLEVSERQYAQAELLHQLIAEEGSDVSEKPRRRVRLALFRWAIAALTVAAVVLPITVGAPSFPLTAQEPQELAPLFDLIRELPADRPALLVYDYDAGYSGELDAISGALIDQVMAEAIPVVSMSTRPAGAPMAVRSIDEYAVRHGYAAGSDLVHLGYLSGGSTAIQLFSVNPREAVLGGFELPEEYQAAGVWETPALQGVNLLSDFSMVAVITAGPETARAWIEQAKPHMADTPLLMVLSAGVEPLVRPYFEAADPQVDGILTGLPAATAYEQRNGRLGPAQTRWNAFGAGILAAEMVLVAGVGYGIVQWWLGRRAS